MRSKLYFVFAVCLLALPAVARADITTGLVGHWAFDEGSGTTAADSSGNGYNGTLVNGPTWIAGKIGQALSFNVTSNRVTTALNPSAVLTNDMTVSFWAYVPSASIKSGFIYSASDSGATRFYFSVNSATDYKLGLGSWNPILSGKIVPDSWQFVTIVESGTTGYVYLNGTQIATQAGITVSYPNDTLAMGNSKANTGYYSGSIDDFRVYSRALSASDIAELYAYSGGGTPPPPPPPSPVNGVCGTTQNSCSAGSFSDVADSPTQYLWSCLGQNGGTNASCSLDIPAAPPADTTPPVLSGVTASSIAQTTAVISWTTNEPADSQISYGLTAAYGSQTSLNPSLVASHSVSLTSLTPNTVYHYQVISKDAAGNVSRSSDGTFTTQVAAPAGPKAWYLDGAATGAGNGTSWTDAWTHIGAIAGLSSGDTVYISGGPSGSSQTYIVDANPKYLGQWLGMVSGVTYKIGQDSLHNGTAIFDGQANNVFLLGGKHDITVSGDAGDGQRHFKVVNAALGLYTIGGNWSNLRINYIDFNVTNQCMRFDGPESGFLEVDHNRLDITAGAKASNCMVGGFSGATFDRYLFHDNDIYLVYDPTRLGWGVDGIVFGGGALGLGGFSVYNNRFYSLPGTFTGGQHQDGWQSQGGSYIKFYNNLFVDIGNYAIFPEGNTSIAVGGFGFTHMYIYNNIAVSTHPPNIAAFALSGSSVVGTDGYAKLLNDVILANNVAVGYSAPYAFSYYDHKTQDPAAFTNCYFYNNISIGGNNNSIDNAVHQAGNVYLTDAQAAADFVSYAPGSGTNNYHLKAAAADLIDRGSSLASFFTTDKDGTIRPRGLAWDVGPYEYDSGYTPPVPPPPAVDTSPPTVSITAPLNGSVSSGNVSVIVTASDNIGVVGVQLKLDGTNLGPELVIPPYSGSWNTTVESNGAHILTATARDAAGNAKTSSSVTVTVNNITAPPVALPSNSGTSGNPSSPSTSNSPAPVPAFTPTVAQPAPAAVNPLVPCSTASSFTRSLALGSTGSDVKALQQFLNYKGFSVAITGNGSKGYETAYFGFATQAALARFQTANSISPAVGFFGPLTMAKVNALQGAQSCNPASPVLAASASFIRDLTLGSSGSDVTLLQKYLNSHGFQVSLTGPGSPNSESVYFGELTRIALSRFQAAKGISPAAGYFGPKTRAVVETGK